MTKNRVLGMIGTFVLAAACAACSGEDEGQATGGANAGSPGENGAGAEGAAGLEVQAGPYAIVRRTAGGSIAVKVHGAADGSLEIEGLPPGIRAETPALASDAVIALSFSGEPAFGEFPIKLRAKSGDQVRERALTLVVADDAGVLDTTFAAKGLLAGGASLKSHHLTVDAQGRALVSGYDATMKAFVARYTASGEPDATFDGDGIATIAFAQDKSSIAVAAMTKGEDVFVGGMNASTFNDAKPCVAKLDGAGKPISGFGKEGIACFDSPLIGEFGAVGTMVVLDDGSVLAGGMGGTFAAPDVFVAKLTPEGALDGSFGVGGIVRWATPAYENMSAMLVDAEGRILVSGVADTSPSAFAPFVMRLTKTGAPDPWFGNGGIATLDRGAQSAGAFGMTLGPKGEIFLSGREGTAPAVYALDPEKGAPLTSFAEGGARTYPELGEGAFNGLAWDDGKLLVSGSMGSGDVTTAFAARVASTDGALDTGFGQNGTVKFPIGINATTPVVIPSARAAMLLEVPTGFVVARAWR